MLIQLTVIGIRWKQNITEARHIAKVSSNHLIYQNSQRTNIFSNARRFDSKWFALNREPDQNANKTMCDKCMQRRVSFTIHERILSSVLLMYKEQIWFFFLFFVLFACTLIVIQYNMMFTPSRSLQFKRSNRWVWHRCRPRIEIFRLIYRYLEFHRIADAHTKTESENCAPSIGEMSNYQ